MKGLRDKLETRLTELTVDLRFSHKPSGLTKAPEVIYTALPKIRPGEWEEADDFPFVKFALFKGAFAKGGDQSCSWAVYGGIWTPGSIRDGSNNILDLTEALGRIVSVYSFSPFILSGGVDFRQGMQDEGLEGMQPHPFHYCGFNVDFIFRRTGP